MNDDDDDDDGPTFNALLSFDAPNRGGGEIVNKNSAAEALRNFPPPALTQRLGDITTSSPSITIVAWRLAGSP